MSDSQHLFQRRGVHPGGEGDPGPQGIARWLCPCRAERRVAHRDRRQTWRPFWPRPTACFLRPPSPTASPISSIAAARRALSGCWTRTRWPLPITAATGNTSRKAISRKTRKAHIFVMDYAHRRRVKIWGEARVVGRRSGVAAIADAEGLKARPEQVILFGSRRGTPIARSTFRRNSTPPTWRRRWPRAMRALRNWRPSWRALKGAAVRPKAH